MSTSYRATVADLRTHLVWQAVTNSRLPASSNVKLGAWVGRMEPGASTGGWGIQFCGHYSLVVAIPCCMSMWIWGRLHPPHTFCKHSRSTPRPPTTQHLGRAPRRRDCQPHRAAIQRQWCPVVGRSLRLRGHGAASKGLRDVLHPSNRILRSGLQMLVRWHPGMPQGPDRFLQKLHKGLG